MKFVLTQSMDFASLVKSVKEFILQISVLKMSGAKKNTVTKGTLCLAIIFKGIIGVNLEAFVRTAMEIMWKIS